MSSGAAIVTTLRNAGPVLDSFVTYHLAIGFEHIFLFFDDPADPDLQRFAANPKVTATPYDAALRRGWEKLPTYSGVAAFIETEVMARQILNTSMAISMARQRGLEWLLHIDADELFFSPSQSAAEHFASLRHQPSETVIYRNLEVVPERDDIGDFFREADLFKVPRKIRRSPLSEDGARLLAATPQLQPKLFHAYNNGKSAVRLSAADVWPLGVHRFGRDGGDVFWKKSRQQFILHYPCCGFDAFWEKYATLGRFPDQWWGKDNIAAAGLTTHLESRDVVATGDRDAARAFYHQRIAIRDREQVAALINAGILARFPQPREILQMANATAARRLLYRIRGKIRALNRWTPESH